MLEIKRDPARDLSEVEWGIAKSTFTDLIGRKKGILETDALYFVPAIGGVLPERVKELEVPDGEFDKITNALKDLDGYGRFLGGRYPFDFLEYTRVLQAGQVLFPNKMRDYQLDEYGWQVVTAPLRKHVGLWKGDWLVDENAQIHGYPEGKFPAHPLILQSAILARQFFPDRQFVSPHDLELERISEKQKPQMIDGFWQSIWRVIKADALKETTRYWIENEDLLAGGYFHEPSWVAYATLAADARRALPNIYDLELTDEVWSNLTMIRDELRTEALSYTPSPSLDFNAYIRNYFEHVGNMRIIAANDLLIRNKTITPLFSTSAA